MSVWGTWPHWWSCDHTNPLVLKLFPHWNGKILMQLLYFLQRSSRSGPSFVSLPGCLISSCQHIPQSHPPLLLKLLILLFGWKEWEEGEENETLLFCQIGLTWVLTSRFFFGFFHTVSSAPLFISPVLLFYNTFFFPLPLPDVTASKLNLGNIIHPRAPAPKSAAGCNLHCLFAAAVTEFGLSTWHFNAFSMSYCSNNAEQQTWGALDMLTYRVVLMGD